jgi:putative drug exporter of the RND superfamily
MLARFAGVVVRRRVLVLVVAVTGVVVAGALGGRVAKSLSSGGFDDPASESSQANHILESSFHSGAPNVVLLVKTTHGVDDAASASEGTALSQELARQPGVTEAVSYWTLGSPPPLRSKDRSEALVLGRIEGTQDEVRRHINDISPLFANRSDAVLTVRVGGFAEVFRQISARVEKDLGKAEAIAVPITLVLLVLVFGSAVSATLPLAVGGLAVVGTLLVLRVIASVTQVSIFSLNLTTGMGLGLAVDYSLFIVSRFREELANHDEVGDAVVQTMMTAGRTVLFSALTVAISLSALLLFPLAFLRSFAYAGIAVVALAAIGAVVVLPAMLAALGSRVNRWAVVRRRPKAVGEGFWHRVATAVMARPAVVALSVVAFLLVLGSPFLRVAFGLSDDRVLPASASSRQVHDEIRAQFSSKEAGALLVVAPGVGSSQTSSQTLLPAVDRYAAALSRLDGVARVDALTGSYIGGNAVFPPGPQSVRFASPNGTWLSVVPSVEPYSASGEKLAHDVRSLPAPFSVKVAGPSAELVDSKSALIRLIPWAAGIIALVTFTLLFLFTGSVVVPMKAVVLNMLSLTATFGAMVWIFQEGHLSGLLGFTATGTIDITTPILMFCIAFGLSMDYEVFLLSRIKEEYDRTGDNTAAVAVGLERTGRIVTAAAALLAIIFVAFSTSGITFIKLFGVGLTLAVVMDATLVRAALVPAFMRLAGRANWWAPVPLRKLYARVGLRESSVLPYPAQPAQVEDPVAGGR